MNRLFNFLKLSVLLAGISALLIAMGYLIGGFSGVIIFLFISLIMNIGTFIFSKQLALQWSGAVPMPKDQYSILYQQTARLSSQMGIPIPELYISPNEFQPNAFATGNSPRNSAVCFTAGILEQLPPEELEGVLAHELAHIKNRDTLVSTIFAVIASAISSIANIGFLFSGFLGGNNEDREEGVNPIVSILAMMLAPLVASLIQFGISRNREYLADATAAEYTKKPKKLADALKRIHYLATNIPMTENQHTAMASLYISNPFSAEGIGSLFSTHPPIEERVKRLNQM